MVEIWGMTDVGLVRKDNQDALDVKKDTASGHSICVVCDGMGGAAGGELASNIAVETYTTELERLLKPGMDPEQLKSLSSFVISMANTAIQLSAIHNEEYADMGTTLVAAVMYEDGAVVSNVGDSRAYHITKDGITRITKDHSLVESMVDHGDITQEEARRHPNRNLITRALGRNSDATCDSYVCPMEVGDYLMLCTDGLVNTVTDEQMYQEIIHGTGGPAAALDNMLEIAKGQGAPDNITVLLIQKQ